MEMFPIVVLFSRAVLMIVFLVSVITKLADRPAFRQTLKEFGIPVSLVPALEILLLIAEIAIPLGLMSQLLAWWSAVLAAALLLIFILAIGINLALGRTPNCHCFGTIHSTPIGWHTVIRNIALFSLALLIVAQGKERVGPSLIAWVLELSPQVVAVILSSTIVFGLLGATVWLLIRILRRRARLGLRIANLKKNLGARRDPSENVPRESFPTTLNGLTIGFRAPAFALPSVSGDTRTLEAFLELGRPVLLLFVDPDCRPCTALLPYVKLWVENNSGMLTTVLVSRGAVEENLAKANGFELTHILLQKDFEVATAYQVEVTPSGVMIDPTGNIASGVAVGTDAIEASLADAVNLNRSEPWKDVRHAHIGHASPPDPMPADEK